MYSTVFWRSTNNRPELCMFVCVCVLMRPWLFLLLFQPLASCQSQLTLSRLPKLQVIKRNTRYYRELNTFFSAAERDYLEDIMLLRSERTTRSRATEVRRNTLLLKRLMGMQGAITFKLQGYPADTVFIQIYTKKEHLACTARISVQNSLDFQFRVCSFPITVMQANVTEQVVTQ